MNDLRNIWIDLVDKKLWPIAAALLLALVAVPMVLAKDAEEPAPVAQVTAEPGPRLPGAVVKRAAEQRIGLSAGSARNPFRPQGFKAAATGTTGATTATAATSAGGAAGTGGAGASDGTGGSAKGDRPSDIVSGGPNGPEDTGAPPTEPSGPVETRVVVTFGVFGGALPTHTFAPLSPLPPASSPFLIYIGRGTDHKTAVFSLAGGISVDDDGDAACKPSRKLCQFIQMKAGDVQAFGANGKVYELTVQRYVRR